MSEPQGDRRGSRAIPDPKRPEQTAAERRRGNRTIRRRDDRRVRIVMQINGESRDVVFEGYKTLLELLREDLALTGTKHGCELGECGACAVLMDGQPVLSCLVLGAGCDGAEIVTIEGVAQGPELHAVQARMADCGGAQCGYCTPGIVLTAKHLLDRNPSPTREEIAEALSGNLCRCTGYIQIFEAVELAAEDLRKAAIGNGQSAIGGARE